VAYIAREERETLSVASVTSIPHVSTSVKFILETKMYEPGSAYSAIPSIQNFMKSANMFKT
jgi:hypothetical protein